MPEKKKHKFFTGKRKEDHNFRSHSFCGCTFTLIEFFTGPANQVYDFRSVSETAECESRFAPERRDGR